MSSIQLVWIGDLDSESRSAAGSDHLRPRRIDIGSGQKEVKFGRENTKNPPDYCLESSINNRMVSRKHATIERSSGPAGNLMLYDHSLNGTYVNYQRVSGAVQLKQGDVVCFGHLNGANIKTGESVAPYHSDLKYKVESVEGKGSTDTKKKKTPAAAGKLPPSAASKRESSHHAFDDDSSDSDNPGTVVANSKKSTAAASKTVGGGGKKAAVVPPAAAKKARRSSDSSPSLSSSSSSESGGEQNTTMRLGAAAGSKKSAKENGGKKSSASLLASSGRKPGQKPKAAGTGAGRKSEPASSTTSGGGKKSTAGPRSAAAGGKGGGTGGAAPPSTGGAVGGGGGVAAFHYENEECSATPCRRPEDLAIDWIQCDRCTKWYHQICVGLTSDEDVDDSESYYCPKCKK